MSLSARDSLTAALDAATIARVAELRHLAEQHESDKAAVLAAYAGVTEAAWAAYDAAISPPEPRAQEERPGQHRNYGLGGYF